MKTQVQMKRKLFDSDVRQLSDNSFISANDMIIAGNRWRAINRMPSFDFQTWKNRTSTKEFISELEKEFGQVQITKRGANGGSWLHPYLAIDLALAISPKLKIDVYKWLYDELLKYRNDSGDSYKKMAGALYANASNKSNFHRGMSLTARYIKNACNVKDWQEATEDQLKLRDRIHENIALLCDVLKDNNQAIRIGINKALSD
jgi:hypothetical protein